MMHPWTETQAELGQGGTGPWAALWEPPAVITGLSLWLEPSSSGTAQ